MPVVVVVQFYCEDSSRIGAVVVVTWEAGGSASRFVWGMGDAL